MIIAKCVADSRIFFPISAMMSTVKSSFIKNQIDIKPIENNFSNSLTLDVGNKNMLIRIRRVFEESKG